MKLKRHRSFILSMVAIILVASSLVYSPSKAEAGYDDNYSRLYYDLARLVYDAKDTDTSQDAIEDELNALHANYKKYKVIESVDINHNSYHEMAASSASPNIYYKLDKTGFKAMAVVAEGSHKIWIAFSGTDNMSTADYNTARVTMSSKNPGQAYHAQLFTNFIYEKYPEYQGFDYYFTGHSLGGWVSTKLYLDIRAANWLIPDKSSFLYGGPVKKSIISGVYTFNPLPMHKNQMQTIQWDKNKNEGIYNKYVKNLYHNNEWLNGIYDMNKDVLNYIGFKGSITSRNYSHYSNVTDYNGFNYISSGVPYDLSDYYFWAKSYERQIVDGHSLKELKYSTYY